MKKDDRLKEFFEKEAKERDKRYKEYVEKKTHETLSPLRGVAQLPRSALALPGQFADLVTLLPNMGLKATGLKEIPSQEKATKEAFDYATSDRYKPTTKQEKLIEAGSDIVGGAPYAAAIKGSKALAVKGSNALKNFLEGFAKPTQLSTAAALTGQHLLNEDPSSPGKAMAGSLAVGLSPAAAKLATSAAKKGFQSTKQHLLLEKLKENPELQEEVLRNIGKRAGAENIEPMGYERSGKYAQVSGARNKDVYKQHFQKEYADIDAFVNKKTDFNTNKKRFIDVNPVADDLFELYKKLETPAFKHDFIESKLGKAFLKMVNLPGAQKGTEHAMNMLDAMVKHDIKTPKMRYEEARELQRSIKNELSKAGEIGTLEQGRMKKVAEKLSDSIGTMFQDDPKMYDKWRQVNNDYMGYLIHRKPYINELHKHKPSYGYSGNPTESFKIASAKALENPDYLDFMMKGLKPDSRDSFIRGLLNKMGSEKGTYNPIKGLNAFNDLQDPVKQRLLKHMSPETRAAFQESQPIIEKYQRTVKKPDEDKVIPHMIKKVTSKALSAAPGALFGSAVGPWGTVIGGGMSMGAKNLISKYMTKNPVPTLLDIMENKVKKPEWPSVEQLAQPLSSTVRPTLRQATHEEQKPILYERMEDHPLYEEYMQLLKEKEESERS